MGKNEEQRPHHADIPQQGDEEKKTASAHLEEKGGGTDGQRPAEERRDLKKACVFM